METAIATAATACANIAYIALNVKAMRRHLRPCFRSAEHSREHASGCRHDYLPEHRHQPRGVDARGGAYLSWVFAIGRIDATCQPVPSWTNVWQIRNVLFWGGAPGRPRVKTTGTRICMTSLEITAA
jgi:hypothetical protein